MPEVSHPLDALLSGSYTVERELGRGGMATVYLASEHKHDRTVAIKVLRPELAASLGAERFLREVGIAARLSHPHIVPLIDSGEAGGLLYYVSSYMAGGSLRARLEREGRLPVPDALRIVQEIGAGLDYVHRAGYVHRDVKPENILFADGHAMLADFGIARAFGGQSSESLYITDTGIVLGTPEYMSPEQASGEHELGSSSDIYSLACVVYEMLVGEPPLRGANARATMAKQVTEIPRSVRMVRPELPPAIDRAVARALAKDPAQRFASVADFTAAMQAEEPGGRRAASRATRSVAVLPFVNASPDPENEYLSDGITDELIDRLAKVDGLRVASRTSVFALKGQRRDIRSLGAALGAAVVLEGTVRKERQQLRITAQLTSVDDGQLLWSHRYDRTLEDVFVIQDEIANTIVNTLRATSFADLAVPPRKRYTENTVAYGLYLKGRYAWNLRTQEGVAQAIEYFEQAIAEDDRYAPAYTGLADSYALHVDYRSVPVDEGFQHAKAYARRALELDESLAEAHASLAWSLFIYDWDWEGADREFRRAIELDPWYATGHQWYAFLLASREQHVEAMEEGLTATELDPASQSARRGVGWLAFYARHFDDARGHLLRAVAMNPTAEETYRALGLVEAVQGRSDDAERTLREAMSIPGAGTYTTATLGYALARAGKRARAEALLAELEARARQEYVSPVSFATLHLGLERIDDALHWTEQAYAERRGWMAYLRVNPIMDPLRDEPRFQALMRRMRLDRR